MPSNYSKSAAKARSFIHLALPVLAGAAVVASCWFGKALAEEKAAESKAAEDGKPAYTKRGPYAGGEKHPAPCDNKLSLPLLIPQAIYDNKEYCGGKITVF